MPIGSSRARLCGTFSGCQSRARSEYRVAVNNWGQPRGSIHRIDDETTPAWRHAPQMKRISILQHH